MVKGLSRQVILVQSPEPKLFEQAIFILREDAPEVTEAALLREAENAIRFPALKKKWQGPLWMALGAAITGTAWAVTLLI